MNSYKDKYQITDLGNLSQANENKHKILKVVTDKNIYYIYRNKIGMTVNVS